MLCAVCEIFHLVGGNVNPGLNRCEGVIIITMSGREGGAGGAGAFHTTYEHTKLAKRRQIIMSKNRVPGKMP